VKRFPQFISSLSLTLATAAAPAAPAVAQLPQPLTAAEVACNAEQLAGILARSTIAMEHASRKPVVLSVTYGSVTGALQGLAYTDQFETDSDLGATPEHHLWFSSNPDETSLLRNPGRPQLDSLSLTRSRLNSDLVPGGHPDAMAVLIDPTLDPANNTQLTSLLQIDNRLEGSGVPSDAKPGRGLADLLTPCHGRLAAYDVHVFGVLAKTLRIFAFSTGSTDPEAFLRSKLVAIYRGEHASELGDGVRAAYRVDVYPITASGVDGRAAFEVLVDVAPDGAVGAASIEALPRCAAAGQRHCSTTGAEVQMAAIRPVGAGQFWALTGLPLACVNAKAGSACPQRASFSFFERLAGTSWLRPLR
jgi:hypothetical protein